MTADDTARTDGPTDEHHYIGVIGVGRLHTTLTGSAADGVDTREPIPVGRWRTPPDEDGPLLYPVSAEIAEAFMDDGDEFDTDDEDES